MKDDLDVTKLNSCELDCSFLIQNLPNWAQFDSYILFFFFIFSVTMSNSDNSTEKICMHTQGKMAKAFLRCWER